VRNLSGPDLRPTVLAAAATALASTSLLGVFRGTGWVWPVVAVIAAAGVGGALGRRWTPTRATAAVVSGLLGVVTVTWWAARDVALLGLLPGPGALRVLTALGDQGIASARRYYAPAPADPGLVLLAMLGVGLVAVLVDTVAVSYRSAAVAGLPLLALYAVPAVMAHGREPVVLFLGAAAGWIGLMLSEGRERVGVWGPMVRRGPAGPASDAPGPSGDTTRTAGRRIAYAAVAVALVLPALAPVSRASLPRWLGGSGGGAGAAAPDGRLDAMVDIGQQLNEPQTAVWFTYTSTAASPEYFRVVTDDTFDGSRWQPAERVDSGSPDTNFAHAADGAEDAIDTVVTIVGLHDKDVPVSYPGGAVYGLADSDWVYDATTGDVFSTGTSKTTKGQVYTVSGRPFEPTASQLRAADKVPPDMDQYTDTSQLPEAVRSWVLAKAQQIIAGQPTLFDRALALQRYFRDPNSGFRYTTTPSVHGNPITSFLQSKAGFCQQFAGTYAVMARLVGLPTRVVVGFTPGTVTSADGTRSVTNRDAHAWPEVYFDGIGWVRFEPTVSSSTSAISPPKYTTQGPPLTTTSPSVTPTPTAGPTHPTHASAQPSTGSAAGAGTGGGFAVPWSVVLALLGVLGVVGLLLAPGAVRYRRRRSRLQPAAGPVSPTRARELVGLAWLELSDTARDLDEPWPDTRTPRRTADWIVARGVPDDAQAAAHRLVGAVERARYASGAVDVLAGTDPGTDARIVVDAMTAGASRRERWRARLAPRSALAPGRLRAAVTGWLSPGRHRPPRR
jgi:transglutaminase-like putative cysteine protease